MSPDIQEIYQRVKAAPDAEKEYRRVRACNYSSMAVFSVSPDKAILETNTTYEMKMGLAFELVLDDTINDISPENPASKFSKKYFILKSKKPIKKISTLWHPDFIDNGEDLKEKYILKADGEHSGAAGAKSLRNIIDQAIEHPGCHPILDCDINKMAVLAGNMQRLTFLAGGKTYNAGAFLRKSYKQVPMFWETDGIVCKSLPDAINFDERVIADIKLTASFSIFEQRLRAMGWVQACHYEAGANANTKDEIPYSFIFLVASMEKPYLVRAYDIGESITEARMRYNDLLPEYDEWMKKDRPVTGCLPQKSMRLYFS